MLTTDRALLQHQTITPQTLGIGLAQSTTQGGTVAKTASLGGYTLVSNGLLAVHFSTPVEAGATLSITTDGGTTYTAAKPIYWNGSAITAGVITYGDTALFVYDGTSFNLIGNWTRGSSGGGAATLPELGGGYAESGGTGNTASTVARTATISGYVLTVGNGPVIEFTNGVNASNATFNVNNGTSNTGAKPLWYKGAALASGVIPNGALVKLVYDGTHYCVESIDTAASEAYVDSAVKAKIMTMTQSGTTYTAGQANVACSTRDDIIARVTAGETILRVNTTTGSIYRAVNARGAASTGRLTFAGETLESDNGDLAVEAFIMDGSGTITRKTLSTQSSSGSGSTTLPELGGGYATASGGSTVAQSVTITGFVRTVGNGPTVKFTSELTAKGHTLNVNNGTDATGAAAIWYCGAALRSGTIKAGALVKFVFDGTHYCVESIDGRPIIQLMPNQGVISISGTYQYRIAKLKGAAVPQIICTTPNTTMQNMELMELRHVWSNDTTSTVKLAGRLGGVEYYVILSQSGSSGSEGLSGTLESVNIAPDVIMQNSSTPTIAIRNNELHDCGTVTRLTITDWPAEGDWGVEFTCPSNAATELIWSGGSHPDWPDNQDTFAPEAGKKYELNVHNGKALIGVWPE